MIFRRTLTALFVAAFVGTATMAMLFLGISRTLLSQDFYTHEFQEPAYELLIKSTVINLQEAHGLIVADMTAQALTQEIKTVFPPELFAETTDEILNEIMELQDDPYRPLTFDLRVYRESLLTLAHNLAFKTYQNTRSCNEEELPETTENGLISCIPSDTAYEDLASQLNYQFEKDIYAAIPEQGQFDIVSAFGERGIIGAHIAQQKEAVKTLLYGILLLLVSIIALLKGRSLQAILKTEAKAFTMAGIAGLLMGFSLQYIPQLSLQEGDELQAAIIKFMSTLMSAVSIEIMKVAAIFLLVGITLFVVTMVRSSQNKVSP